ncbi:unnamed protein product [Nippostrongylus brasiliensis]|uniref:Uncharacterized protein n=1 Tax=Nippostrongylus brasiliensis TaxID=27835 RepID=A0A0N4YZJ5_NIPBR|nr:unnamed protein product [Nippostrongylus brasiliensis]
MVSRLSGHSTTTLTVWTTLPKRRLNECYVSTSTLMAPTLPCWRRSEKMWCHV